jgi:pimeloyl-ACP methyl ester carboxylesterase
MLPAMGGVGPLEIWINPAPGGVEPAAFCLILGGMASRAERTAVRFRGCRPDPAVCPAETWSLNYPGFGGSAGAARLSVLAPAALAAFDALHSHAAGRPVAIIADSLGTAVALHVAAHRPAAALVLQNPPPLRELIVGVHGWWNLWAPAAWFAAGVPDALDSLANAARCHAPAVFLSAGRDRLVPPTLQRSVFAAYAGPKVGLEMPRSRHHGPPPGEVARRAAAVLASVLSGRRVVS